MRSQLVEQHRQMVECRIVFEEYLSDWVKIATTRTGYSMEEEALDELMEHPGKVAAHYDVTGSETNELVEGLHKTFKDIVYDPKPRSSKNRRSRRTRVEQMRRIYLPCGPPDAAAPRGGPTPREPAHDAERQERWESEVDKLIAWTDSLSFEELDGP